MRVQTGGKARLSRLAVVALIAASLGSSLAGCASGSCTGDPKTDNVWCADKGINSGLYEADLKAKEKTLADVQGKAASERAKGRQLRERLAALRTRRQRIERELAALLSRLTQATRQKGSQQARIAALRTEIARALEEQRTARIRLDEAVRRLESGKAGDTTKAAIVTEKVVLDEEEEVLNDERGMRMFAQQVDEVTRT
jgi:chromosome segregation ATPase